MFAQEDFSYAITDPRQGDQRVFAWGCNDHPGRLGVGDTKDRFVPTEVFLGAPLQIEHFSGRLAVTTTGKAYVVRIVASYTSFE